MTYFFDIQEDNVFVKDDFGIDLNSDREACIEAQSIAMELMRIFNFYTDKKLIKIEVRCDNSDVLYACTLETSSLWVRKPSEIDRDAQEGLPESRMLQTPCLNKAIRNKVTIEEDGHVR